MAISLLFHKYSYYNFFCDSTTSIFPLLLAIGAILAFILRKEPAQKPDLVRLSNTSKHILSIVKKTLFEYQNSKRAFLFSVNQLLILLISCNAYFSHSTQGEQQSSPSLIASRILSISSLVQWKRTNNRLATKLWYCPFRPTTCQLGLRCQVARI